MFQCLTHTLELETAQWGILDQVHRKRNLAEYEGETDADEAMVLAQIRTAEVVARRVAEPSPVSSPTA